MIPELIERARARHLRNLILAQSANVVSVALGATVLLLLAGTQLLDWHWLAALALATAGAIVYRTQRRAPSAYRMAQDVDRRLKLADSLSTALFFAGSQPASTPAGPMRQAQLRQAEDLARGVDLDLAVPLKMPRAMYTAAALGLVASGLFALRYGLERRLELRAPLAQLLMQKFGGPMVEEMALRTKPPAPIAPQTPKPARLPIPDTESQNTGELDPASDSALDTVGVPDAVNEALGKNDKTGKTKASGSGSEQGEGEQGEDTAASSGANLSDAANGGEPGRRTGEQPAGNNGNKPSAADASENATLMSKIKEAMANLMSKMRQQTGSSGSRQSQSGQSGRMANGQTRPGQKGAANQGQQQSGRDSGEEQDQQASSEGQNGESAQAKAGGRSSDQQSASQPGSGIGRQDGNKDTKLADQLAAMGKISEIIGKRSANVNGEVTVEVQSSQQQLRTPYSASKATHADGSGDLDRDEVPVVFQQFVREYFDRVRRTPPSVTSKSNLPAARGKAPANSNGPPTL